VDLILTFYRINWGDDVILQVDNDTFLVKKTFFLLLLRFQFQFIDIFFQFQVFIAISKYSVSFDL